MAILFLLTILESALLTSASLQRNLNTHSPRLQQSLYVLGIQLSPRLGIFDPVSHSLMQDWHSKPQPQEQANTADEFARKIMHAEDPKNVDLPSNALKADESKQYANMRNMLRALITLNVCGEMRSSQGGLTRDTNKVLINEAQAGLADDLWRWRERCKALLKEWRYDTVHKAQPWHVWLKRLGERVVAASHTWDNNKKEGIRQAAQIIASLSPFLPFTLLWLTLETPQLAKTSEQIRQEVVSPPDLSLH